MGTFILIVLVVFCIFQSLRIRNLIEEAQNLSSAILDEERVLNMRRQAAFYNFILRAIHEKHLRKGMPAFEARNKLIELAEKENKESLGGLKNYEFSIHTYFGHGESKEKIKDHRISLGGFGHGFPTPEVSVSFKNNQIENIDLPRTHSL